MKRLLLIDGRQNQKRRSTAEQTLSENHALIMHRFRQSRTGIQIFDEISNTLEYRDTHPVTGEMKSAIPRMTPANIPGNSIESRTV